MKRKYKKLIYFILIAIFAIALILTFFLPTKKSELKKEKAKKALEKPLTTDLT